MELVKATPQAPGRPAVPGASAKVEAELGKLRKGWEAAEHRGIDLKVELLQTQVEARTLRASLHGSEVEARHALQAQEAMQAHIDELEARLPEMEARRGEAREAQSAAEARRDELDMMMHVMDAERLRALGEAEQVGCQYVHARV